MKNNIFKNSVISMLSVFILLLLSSQVVLAVKPGTVVTPTATAIIDSVVVGIDTIVVTGSDLDSISTVTLGGLTVTFSDSYDTGGNLDGKAVFIAFTDIDDELKATDAEAVLTAGNYSLVLDDNVFSIYLSATDAAAITPEVVVVVDPGVTSCRCTTGWEASSISLDNSFSCSEGVDNSDSYNQSYLIGTKMNADFTVDVISTFFDPGLPSDMDISNCSLNPGSTTLDSLVEPVTNQEQYDNCITWMKANVCTIPIP